MALWGESLPLGALLGNLKKGMPTEKVMSRGFRTGVRFPSDPPMKAPAGALFYWWIRGGNLTPCMASVPSKLPKPPHRPRRLLGVDACFLHSHEKRHAGASRREDPGFRFPHHKKRSPTRALSIGGSEGRISPPAWRRIDFAKGIAKWEKM